MLLAHTAVPEQIVEATRRIAEAPGDARAVFDRAELHRSLGHWRAARGDYERSLRLDPKLDAALLGLGTMELEAGRPRVALRHLERFLDLHPSHVAARLSFARALVAAGREAQGVDEYESAIELAGAEGARPEPSIELARLLCRMKPPRIDQALEWLERGRDRMGAAVAIELEIVNTEREGGRVAEALARLDALARSLPRSEAWCERRSAIAGEEVGRGRIMSR